MQKRLSVGTLILKQQGHITAPKGLILSSPSIFSPAVTLAVEFWVAVSEFDVRTAAVASDAVLANARGGSSADSLVSVFSMSFSSSMLRLLLGLLAR